MSSTTEAESFPISFERIPSSVALAEAEREKILADPGFGTNFTDHMVVIDWSITEGWHSARVVPYGPFQLDPSAAVLHYGQEIFEGLKVYRHPDGSLWTFRPDENAKRFQRSAERMGLPSLAVADFLEALRQLMDADGSWVPSAPETSLYVRPFMFASEAFLGVRPAQQVTFAVIASPASVYFHGGVAPVSIWLSTRYSRAGRGGTGAAKCGGNYAASLRAQAEAYENDCAQVLFLDAETGTHLEEFGGMNLFLVYRDGTLVTPRLSGSILPGITRDSVIALARERGHTVIERDISLEEWSAGALSGEIAEAFACGTAAGITPVGELKGENVSIGSAHAPAGEVTLALRRKLNDIQYGRMPDTRGWLMRIE